MKTLLKYNIIFIVTIMILLIMLIATAIIPKEKIENNIKESLPYLSQGREINYIKKKHHFMWLHIYADEMILNIIYNIDNNEILESVMKASYYYNGFFSLEKQIKDKNIKPNNEYIRYWHGSMIFIRPLLTVLNIHGIYIFHAVVLSILIILLIYNLWKKKVKFLIPIFIVAFLMTGSLFVPFCLEYYWNYLIMLIITIIAINIDNKNNKRLYMLFFISGILTCFFDFLSTEEITVLVPLVFVVAIRIKKEQMEEYKKQIKLVIGSLAIWFIGYALTWFAKWFLASLILHINALDYTTEEALIRINGNVWDLSGFELILESLEKNIFALYPISLIENKMILLILPIILITIFFIFRKKEKNYKRILLFFIISIIPYLRYAILANHSYKHHFFTFRTQFAVIMSILLIFYFCIDINKFKKKNKGKKYETRNRINDTNSSIG